MQNKRLLALALTAVLLAGCAGTPDASSQGSTSSGGSSSSSSTDSSGTVSSSSADSSQQQEVPTGPNVWTDWSKLDARPARIVRKEVYRRATAAYVDHLSPRSDYGTLIPYAGSVAVTTDVWGDPVYLYGLMTLDGTVVVDPVYADVSIPVTKTDGRGNPQEQSEVMVLQQISKEKDDPWNGTVLVGISALDGSWCTEVAYLACMYKDGELALYAPDRVERWSIQGELLDQWNWAELGIDGERVGRTVGGDNLIFWSNPHWWGDFIWLGWGDEGYRVFNLSTGAVEEYTHEQLDEMYPSDEDDDEDWIVTQEGESTRLTRGEEEHLIPCVMRYARVRGGLVFFSESDGMEAVYTLDGKALVPKGRYKYLNLLYDQLHQDQPAALLQVRHLDGRNQLLDFAGKQAAPWEDGADAELWEGIWGQHCADGWVTYHRLDTGECIMSRMIGLMG